jgi:hypothetical protein
MCKNKTKNKSKEKVSIYETFDSLTISSANLRFELNESELQDNEKLSKKILAVIEGKLIIPGGRSRNGREYVKNSQVNFWEVILTQEEVVRRFKDGQVLGRLGHYEGAVTEQQMEEGKVTHRVVNIDYETGEGKIYVLDTPSGRNLMTHLESGTILYVSSRGDGTFRDLAKTIVDWENYDFETIDFVLRPGFLEAKPSISKINENLDKNIIDKKRSKMDEKEMLDEINKVGKEKEALASENGKLTAVNENLVKEKAEKEKILNESLDKLKLYESLGSPEEIKNFLSEATAQIKSYTKFGVAEKIDESLKTLNEYKELGEVSKLDEALNILEEYKELGTVKEIKEGFEFQKQIIESYEQATGGLEKAKKQAEISEKYKNKYNLEGAVQISEKFDITLEKAESLIKEHGKTKTISILESLDIEKNISDYGTNYKPKKKDSINESKEVSPASAIFASIR